MRAYQQTQTKRANLWIVKHDLDISEDEMFAKKTTAGGYEYIDSPVILLNENMGHFVGDISWIDNNTVEVRMAVPMKGMSIVYKEEDTDD